MTDEELIEKIAQMYAYSLARYGVDLSEKYETAVSMDHALNHAYLKGVEEGRKKMRTSMMHYNGWIPFEMREADEEEKETYGYDTLYIMCGKLPEDGEEILVTYSNGCVGADTFIWDGFDCYLDSGLELVEKAVAWMPMPKPYKGD